MQCIIAVLLDSRRCHQQFTILFPMCACPQPLLSLFAGIAAVIAAALLIWRRDDVSYCCRNVFAHVLCNKHLTTRQPSHHGRSQTLSKDASNQHTQGNAAQDVELAANAWGSYARDDLGLTQPSEAAGAVNGTNQHHTNGSSHLPGFKAGSKPMPLDADNTSDQRYYDEMTLHHTLQSPMPSYGYAAAAAAAVAGLDKTSTSSHTTGDHGAQSAVPSFSLQSAGLSEKYLSSNSSHSSISTPLALRVFLEVVDDRFVKLWLLPAIRNHGRRTDRTSHQLQALSSTGSGPGRPPQPAYSNASSSNLGPRLWVDIDMQDFDFPSDSLIGRGGYAQVCAPAKYTLSKNCKAMSSLLWPILYCTIGKWAWWLRSSDVHTLQDCCCQLHCTCGFAVRLAVHTSTHYCLHAAALSSTLLAFWSSIVPLYNLLPTTTLQLLGLLYASLALLKPIALLLILCIPCVLCQVHRAVYQDMPVAVKLLLQPTAAPDGDEPSSTVQRFRDEAATHVTIHHPNIIRLV